MSIRTHILLVLATAAVFVAFAVGMYSVREAGHAIEDRLIHAQVENMARLASELRLPPSARLLQQLAGISGTDMAAADGGRVVGSTLGRDVASEFATALAYAGRGEDISVGGVRYRVGGADVSWETADGLGERRTYRLLLLMPVVQLRGLQWRAASSIVVATLAALAVATVSGFWLAGLVSRPVQRLADRMDEFPVGSEGVFQAGTRDLTGPVPAEIQRLWRSFDRLQGRLADAQGRLQESARLAAVGQLAATVAHELRNPLSGIKMNARILAEERGAQGQDNESVTWIAREADRMEDYVASLLEMRQLLKSGDGEIMDHRSFTSVPVDLAAQIRHVSLALGPRCRHAGVEFSVEVGKNAAWVRADSDHLRQVLMNLFLNALDAVAGRVAPQVCVKTREQPSGTVRCLVQDSGPGVADDVADKLFEPFVTTKPGGTGLGLHICQRIISGHGGRMGWTSGTGGTVFWFELPGAEAP